MLDKFLGLLWKCKPLFKIFVWIDYVIRFKRFPKAIKLRDNRHQVRIIDKHGNHVRAFYVKICFPYEPLAEIRPN